MSKLTQIAKELLIIDEDLTSRLDYLRCKKELESLRGDLKNYYELYMFEQSLNESREVYESIQTDAGERKIDDSYTFPLMTRRVYVFIPKPELKDEMCFVFFGGKFVYAVPYSKKVMDDVNRRIIADADNYIERYMTNVK